MPCLLSGIFPPARRVNNNGISESVLLRRPFPKLSIASSSNPTQWLETAIIDLRPDLKRFTSATAPLWISIPAVSVARMGASANPCGGSAFRFAPCGLQPRVRAQRTRLRSPPRKRGSSAELPTERVRFGYSALDFRLLGNELERRIRPKTFPELLTSIQDYVLCVCPAPSEGRSRLTNAGRDAVAGKARRRYGATGLFGGRAAPSRGASRTPLWHHPCRARGLMGSPKSRRMPRSGG